MSILLFGTIYSILFCNSILRDNNSIAVEAAVNT